VPPPPTQEENDGWGEIGGTTRLSRQIGCRIWIEGQAECFLRGTAAAGGGVTQAIKRLEARAATGKIVANKLNELARLSIVSD